MRQRCSSDRTRPPAQIVGVLLVSTVMFTVAVQAPQAQAPQRPQFEATVNRVRVDVIVTDDEGNFIEDLVPQDFRLFEDGVEQQVLQAQLVNLDAGFIRDLSALADVSPGLADPEDSGPDPVAGGSEEASPDAGDLGALVYLVDIGKLGYWERRRFARGWAELLDQTHSCSFPRAVYMIDYRGYLRELAPLTYDVDLLQELSADLLTAIYTQSDQDWVFEHPDWQANLSDRRDEDFTGVASRIRSQVQAVNTADFLSAICDSLLGRQGRKALIWVSPGVRLSSPGDMDMRDMIAYEAWEELQRRANAANVSIYGLDPTLVTQRHRPWTRVNSDVGPVESIRRDPFETARANSDALRDSLILAANWTGGKAYPFRTQVGQVLQEIETDTARFYLLTYATPPPLGDGEYHEVRVEVDRPRIEVRARQGYTDHAEQDRRNLVAASSLALPGSVLDLPVTAGAFYTWTEAGEPEIQLAVDVRGITDAIDPAPANPSLQLYFAVVSEDRKLLDTASHIVSWRAEEEGLETGATGTPAVYLHRWPLGYGNFDLRVLAIVEDSGRMGAARVKIEVPEPSPEFRVSQPLLLVHHPDWIGPPEPSLDDLVHASESASVFFEVYGQTEPDVNGRIVSVPAIAEAVGPEAPTDEPVEMEPLELDVYFTREPESSILKAWLPLPAGLEAGSYVIEVRVVEPGGEGEQVFELPLQIVG